MLSKHGLTPDQLAQARQGLAEAVVDVDLGVAASGIDVERPVTLGLPAGLQRLPPFLISRFVVPLVDG